MWVIVGTESGDGLRAHVQTCTYANGYAFIGLGGRTCSVCCVVNALAAVTARSFSSITAALLAIASSRLLNSAALSSNSFSLALVGSMGGRGVKARRERITTAWTWAHPDVILVVQISLQVIISKLVKTSTPGYRKGKALEQCILLLFRQHCVWSTNISNNPQRAGYL